jgi:hypothetical protein
MQEEEYLMREVKRPRDYQVLFEEFFTLYSERPLQSNPGGMGISHMFATWIFLREADPELVVESGVWKGQSTWLMERATTADIVSIDLMPAYREYHSPRATYSDIDFAHMDWSKAPKAKTVLFFDDHVNQFRRLLQGRAWGFGNFIFEDNYPAGFGDTPSLRQMREGAYDGLGPSRKPMGGGWRGAVKRAVLPLIGHTQILSERYDPDVLCRALATLEFDYEEFPPLKTFSKTRWGSDWHVTYGDTPGCLKLETLSVEALALIEAEGRGYTSICNVRAPDQSAGSQFFAEWVCKR